MSDDYYLRRVEEAAQASSDALVEVTRKLAAAEKRVGELEAAIARISEVANNVDITKERAITRIIEICKPLAGRVEG